MSDHADLPARPTPTPTLHTSCALDPQTPVSLSAQADGVRSMTPQPRWIAFAHEILAVLQQTKWAGSYPNGASTSGEAAVCATDRDAMSAPDSDAPDSDTEESANPWEAQAAQVEAEFQAAMTKILPSRQQAKTQPWRPKAATLLAALRIAKTFGSGEEMSARLNRPPALSLIGVGQSTLLQTVHLTLTTLGTDLPALCRDRQRPDVLLAEAAAREPPHDPNKTFVALSDRAAGALEHGTAVVFVATVAGAAPKALRDLHPDEIQLAPLDQEMLCVLLRLIYPDLDMPTAIAGLPDHLPFARLSASTLTLALRSAEPEAAIRAIASALSPASDLGQSLAHFPLPQDVRAAVNQMISDVRAWQTGTVAWKDIPRGLLLSGPPGGGKTELARLIAKETGIAVVHGSLAQWSAQSARGSDVIKNMRAAFASAAEQAPSVLFIDEIDAFGSRARPHDHNSAYTDYIVTALIDLMDGFQSIEGVLLIAATNLPSKLDTAITRAGRFDLRLRLEHPDIDQLPTAFRWHLADDLAGADLASVARAAIGLSGADIAAVVRAARAKARAARRGLALEDLTAAVAEIRPPLPLALRKRIALHEAGHAIISTATGWARPERLVLSATGGSMLPSPQARETDRAAIEAELAVALGGRAAEMLVLGSPATGSGGDEQSDLARATALATALECSFGFGESLVWHGPLQASLTRISQDMDLRRRVEAHLRRAEARAMHILRANRAPLAALAAALLDAGVVQGQTLDAHLAGIAKEARPEAEQMPDSQTAIPGARCTTPSRPSQMGK